MDATSKWPEIFRLNRITSNTTILTLKTIFARFGLPIELVSDNGPQFTSQEFKRFMLVNGIVHHRGAPYHPQTNGLAERVVQSVKKASHKMRDQPGTFEDKLQCFLTSYRNTPHKSTGKTPAEVLLGRQNRGKFDLFQPTDLMKKEKIKAEFQAGEKVMAMDFYLGKNKWLEGVVNHRIGNFSYEVQIGHQIIKRHCSQLLPRGRTEPEETCDVMLPQVESASRDRRMVTTGITTENQLPIASPTPSQATAGPKDLPAVPTEAEVMKKQPAVLSEELTEPVEASLHPGLALTPKSTWSLTSRAEHSVSEVGSDEEKVSTTCRRDKFNMEKRSVIRQTDQNTEMDQDALTAALANLMANQQQQQQMFQMQ
ncbi:uncharacterized protein K02A2.6-like [Daphnia magna]|uniref:uncharacterized protein K02A2.6-like n=1 Tax=Daphnia magna TaxID=35525 RepID=UPI001E1BD1B2|nr:uncharacterized protein K02A2.6-like [Daphnia magna]